MGTIYIGSARADENKKYSGGKAGDQRQTSNQDYVGEVSMQKFYVHSKGWMILRAKSINVANKLADSMLCACNNVNIGYSQSDRLGIISLGTNSLKPCNCDCSSLVRQCVKEASGVDAGNFNTSAELTMLSRTDLFMSPIEYTVNTVLFNGDILVTKTKGHTAIVVFGNPRVAPNNSPSYYFPKYNGKSDSLSDALAEMGIDNSKEHRRKIAKANGINDYTFSATQNIKLLELLKNGKLKKP